MKILCIGRNYVAHAKEMNSETPQNPVLFLKPETAFCTKNSFQIPIFSNEIHHEVELVFRICKNGKNIPLAEANQYYDQVGLGIDFTARDLQKKLKQKGLPWEISKSFDNAAFVSSFFPITDFDLTQIQFHLKKNDTVVQKGNSSQMIFSINKLIQYSSQFFTLNEGDLIFTGTPEGVEKVRYGDVLSGYLFNKKVFEVKIK